MSHLEKYGKRIRPDWRNTARAATAEGSDMGPNVEVKKEKKEECSICLVSIIFKKVITFPQKVRIPSTLRQSQRENV